MSEYQRIFLTLSTWRQKEKWAKITFETSWNLVVIYENWLQVVISYKIFATDY